MLVQKRWYLGACPEDRAMLRGTMRPSSRKRCIPSRQAQYEHGVAKRKPDLARYQLCLKAVDHPTQQSLFECCRRAREIELYRFQFLLFQLPHHPKQNGARPISQAHQASAGGAWLELLLHWKETRSPQTAWKTPDAQRQQPGAQARFQNTR